MVTGELLLFGIFLFALAIVWATVEMFFSGWD